MTIDTVETKIRARLMELTAMRCKVRFNMDDAGTLLLDATQVPPTLTRGGEGDADCTISMSVDNMLKLLDGQLSPTIAYTMGKLKVQGSMGLALKLSSLLED